MQDLLLWRLLRAPTLKVETLTPLLRGLAGLPLSERLPFLGLLPRALKHPDANLREAAVAALVEATGPQAIQQLVAALDDPAPPVRRAAVEALRRSVLFDVNRWIHALFHPDAEVRRAAVTGDNPFAPDWHLLYVLPDPACTPHVLPRLENQVLPWRLLPMVLDQAAAGLLPRFLARRLVALMFWPELESWLNAGRKRTEEEIGEILVVARRPDGEELLRVEAACDEWDALVDLFWDGDADPPSTGDVPHATRNFLNGIVDLRFNGIDAAHHRERILAALLVTAARRGLDVDWAARACGALHPGAVAFRWLPTKVRRRAACALYDLGERCPRWEDAAVRELLDADVCRRPSGNLDLAVVGAILHLLARDPYRRVQEWFGKDLVVASFLEDVEQSAPFLSLEGNSGTTRQDLVREICHRDVARRPHIMAALIHVFSADRLDFLDPLDGRGACQVFEALLQRALDGKTLSDRRARRAGEALGRKIAAGHAGPFLRAWLKAPTPEEIGIGLHVLRVVARTLDAKPLLQTALALEPESLRKFLTATTWCAGFPYEKEREIARGLAAHADEEVRAWAARRLPPEPEGPRKATGKKGGRLPTGAAQEIARCPADRLAAALGLHQPGLKVGLCEALARRPDPAAPSVGVCLALLGSHDPVAEVAEQFRRFGADIPDFIDRLDQEMVETWRGEAQLPLLGHAWLYRWEEHARALTERLAQGPGGPARGLRAVLALPAPVLVQRVWLALDFLMGLWRWRDRPRLTDLCTLDFGEVLVDGLASRHGEIVAGMLLRLRDDSATATFVSALRGLITSRLFEISEPARFLLMPWIDSHGLVPPPPEPAPVPPPSAAPFETLERVRASSDLGELELWCGDELREVATEAGRRLVALRAPGVARLAKMLRNSPPLPAAADLAKTLMTCPWADGLPEPWDCLEDEAAPPEVRFWLGLALYRRHKAKVALRLFAAVCEEASAPWFTAAHWDALLAAGISVRQAAVGLAASPHPLVYTRAVEYLFTTPLVSSTRHALLAFLEAGTERTRDLRVRAAEKLAGKCDEVLPLLLQEEGRGYPKRLDLFKGLPRDLVEAIVAGVLTAGGNVFAEEYLLDFLAQPGVDEAARDAGYRRLLLDACNSWVKHEVANRLRPTLGKNRLLGRVANTFAWGVQMGRELTGKQFGVEMLGGDDLGYTRFEQNKIFINPLPILRGEMLGREVVEGLILHELGHHMYHRGTEAQRIWREAQDAGMHPLLNLVADEHLERNLRARDAEHGDKLKRLGAYAFQHSQREIFVETLLEGLQGGAFRVLTASRLGVGRKWGCVSVDSGRVLHEIEKTGLSFARFLRALRMGLGNRHQDPKVAEGLALFRGKFRRSTMPDLMAVARRLRAIFGWETDLLNALGQEFALDATDADLAAEGEGINNADVQSEVRRILDPRRREGRRSGEDGGGTGLNLSPEEEFNLIHTVEQVQHDPAEHAPLAEQVARPARQMRRYFEQLGLALEPERFRMRGKSFDRTRAMAVVLRGDPRMLIARKAHVRTDLFLGVVIDCSGSMQSANNMAKAKLFGALLAEAAKEAPGVDLRLFGFTDQVIYDAGTAKRCAVHGLYANGGNNDAAGLWHAAQVARASRRKAKLLVMISDGLPTECSVAALRGLVTRLTRRFKMCCAQVAVQPLAEVCFPHYVLLNEDDLAASVRHFGNVIARLVQKALRGG